MGAGGKRQVAKAGPQSPPRKDLLTVQEPEGEQGGHCWSSSRLQISSASQPLRTGDLEQTDR